MRIPHSCLMWAMGELYMLTIMSGFSEDICSNSTYGDTEKSTRQCRLHTVVFSNANKMKSILSSFPPMGFWHWWQMIDDLSS